MNRRFQETHNLKRDMLLETADLQKWQVDSGQAVHEKVTGTPITVLKQPR